MKKEAVNTFSGGLNYDLNPITTPNNVLTECINGTFITFNGDELALQNDAGNTKIGIGQKNESGTYDKYVSLTEGFYPIGIKEYGGVLYIVSGYSLINSAKPWSADITYSSGDIVIYDNNYYLSSIDENDAPINVPTLVLLEDGNILMDEDGDLMYEEQPGTWISLGDITIAKNNLKENGPGVGLTEFQCNEHVEFGSYPSPKVEDSSELGNVLEYNVDDISELTITKIVNNAQFKADRYVVFSNTGSDLTNISYQIFTNYVKTESTKVYKVRLLQQLTNGFIDLTDSVWEQYAKLQSGNLNTGTPSPPLYWFNDPNFKFYCPNNFKGKLAIVTDIEELLEYKLNYCTINLTETDYVLEFNITLNNPTTLAITDVRISYTLDGISATPEDILLSGSGTTKTFSLSIPKINKNKLLAYTIKPIFKFGGVETELPTTYLAKYILSGQEVLNTSFEDVRVVAENYICDYSGGTGHSIYNWIALKNANDEYLDNELKPVTEEGAKYVFYNENSAQPVAPYYWLGTFVIDSGTGKAVISSYNGALTLSGKDVVEPLVEDTVVYQEDPDCTSVIVDINFSELLFTADLVTLTQDGITYSTTGTEFGKSSEAYPLKMSIPVTMDVTVVKTGGHTYTYSASFTPTDPAITDYYFAIWTHIRVIGSQSPPYTNTAYVDDTGYSENTVIKVGVTYIISQPQTVNGETVVAWNLGEAAEPNYTYNFYMVDLQPLGQQASFINISEEEKVGYVSTSEGTIFKLIQEETANA